METALDTDRRLTDANQCALRICTGRVSLSLNAAEFTSKPHPSLRPPDALLGGELVNLSIQKEVDTI